MTGPSSIPPDPALPQLHALLDSDRMRGILARLLEPDQPEPEIRIGYLRYRPARSLLVTYEVRVGATAHEVFALADAKADLAARAAAPDSAALAEKLGHATPARTRLAYEPELNALIQWLPVDVALPAMAEPPERLRERIVAAGLRVDADDLPRIVKHKPTTRGVLRLNEHFLKAYPDDDSFADAVRGLEASASLPFPTARCTAVMPEFRIAAQSLLPGRRPEHPSTVAAQAGALLASLHATPFDDLPLERAGDQLRRTTRQARLLATIVPRLRPRLDRLLSALERGAPSDGLVSSHGGFHSSQLLQSDGELGVVDFDGMCLAPAARDLASYLPSLVEGPEDLQRAAETLDVLVEAYGSRPPGLSWYVATSVLGRARRPFTRLQEEWPTKVEERVAAAEAALDL